MKRLLALLAITMPVAANAAGPMIRCERPNSEPITITLGARQEFGASLNCLYSGFIYDMTPCAPTNGWGMSAGTGTAPLIGIGRRWQDYMTHMGPLAYSAVSETQILFTGGFKGYEGAPKEIWSVTIDRVTGRGVVKFNKAEMIPAFMPQAGNYTCRAVTRKF